MKFLTKMIYKCLWIATLILSLTACYNSGNNNDDLNYSDAKDIAEYHKIAKAEENPAEAYKNAFAELRILHQNKTDIKTIGYDSCINKALADKINYLKNSMELNVIDSDYLNYLVIDSIKSLEEEAQWRFMHSNNFNLLSKPKDVGDDKAKASLSLAYMRKIIDNRFTLIIHKEAKLLPRTNKPNYVLGGFYEGYALLYDLKSHQVICYFNYRINNSSNYRKDYSANGKPVFENMMVELKNIHQKKLKNLVAEKLNLAPFQINLGFVK